MGRSRTYFGRCCCCSLRKRKKWLKWSSGSVLAPCWETGSWLEGVCCPLWLTCKGCFVAEFYLGFAVCLPCLGFCFGPFPSPIFHLSLSFFLNYFFRACFSSRLYCKDLTHSLPIAGDHFRPGGSTSYQPSQACGRWGLLCTENPTLSNVHVAFCHAYGGKARKQTTLSIGWIGTLEVSQFVIIVKNVLIQKHFCWEKFSVWKKIENRI